MTIEEIMKASAPTTAVEAELDLENMVINDNYEIQGINRLDIVSVEKPTTGSVNQLKYNRILHVTEHTNPEIEYTIRLNIIGDGQMLARQYRDICEQIDDSKPWSMDMIDNLAGKEICIFVSTNTRGYITYNFNATTIYRLFKATTK